jgi:hypothetical protein
MDPDAGSWTGAQSGVEAEDLAAQVIASARAFDAQLRRAEL